MGGGFFIYQSQRGVSLNSLAGKAGSSVGSVDINDKVGDEG